MCVIHIIRIKFCANYMRVVVLVVAHVARAIALCIFFLLRWVCTVFAQHKFPGTTGGLMDSYTPPHTYTTQRCHDDVYSSTQHMQINCATTKACVGTPRRRADRAHRISRSVNLEIICPRYRDVCVCVCECRMMFDRYMSIISSSALGFIFFFRMPVSRAKTYRASAAARQWKSDTRYLSSTANIFYCLLFSRSTQRVARRIIFVAADNIIARFGHK